VRYLLLTLVLSLPALSVGDAQNSLPRVPSGFEIEVVAESPLVEHPMMGGFDHRGRLYIAESAGLNLRADDLLETPPNMIRCLEDTNGDGKFDRSTIFADKMTLPMGALWYRDSLYVASPPYIWRLQDTDDDGVADVREILAGTFGFSGNAASVHGCFLSPSGRIFWCDGRHGHEFQDETGQILSKGKAARIFSCRPDGSDLKTFCGGGMDNPVEVDFSETGEVVGTVNILFGRPRVDALVHWLPDGVYPREDQGDCVAEFDHTGSLLSPISSLGHVAVSGTTRYRSTQFGDEYQDNYFISVFNTQRIVRSILTPAGSTWTSTEEDFLVSANPDFHPTDVIEDADGSLLVIDTGGWFRIGCPESQIAKPDLKGAIYRIRKTGAHQIADPRGQSIDWKELSTTELANYLDDSRPAVRELAIDKLALHFGGDRGRALSFAKSISWSKQSETFRRNYLWGISRISADVFTAYESAYMMDFLQDESESVRQVALKVLADLSSDIESLDLIVPLLSSPNHHVQRVAARSIEDILVKSKKTFSDSAKRDLTLSLLKALENPQVDRHLEHTVVHALLKVGHRESLQFGLNHESPAIRRASLIVLSQRANATLTSADVFTLLSSSDQLLQKEALRVIEQHPEWIAATRDQLSEWFSQPDLSKDQQDLLRGFLPATFDRQEVSSTVKDVLEQPSTSDDVRRFLLETLDFVALNQLDKTWSTALNPGLDDSSEDILLQTMRLIRKTNSPDFDQKILEIFQAYQSDEQIGLAALTAIAPRLDPVPDSCLEFLLRLLVDHEQTLSSLAAAETLVSFPKLSDHQIEILSSKLPAAPAHTLPAFKPLMTSSSSKLQVSYLKSILKQIASDRFSEGELADWNKQSSIIRVKELIADVIASRETVIKERQQTLTSMLPQLNEGEPGHGKRIFFSRKAACSGCHRIENEGGQVGPDLSQIGRIRSERDLLEAIVFPSASFARGYEAYTIVTDSGRSYSGVIQSETATEIILITTDRRTIRISRSEVELLKQSPVSVMPQGIHKQLSSDELRHLLSYLRSLQDHQQ
jgi:putative heme-binding domain-containing protein